MTIYFLPAPKNKNFLNIMQTLIQKKPKISTCFWSILIIIFVVELLVYTWCRVQFVQIGYEIRQQEEKHQKLLKLQNELKIEQARLKSPERITRIASQQLNMIMPGPEQIKVIP